jgi:hypothetical protein
MMRKKSGNELTTTSAYKTLSHHASSHHISGPSKKIMTSQGNSSKQVDMIQTETEEPARNVCDGDG